MQYGALRTLRSAPHVIVVGNEKGGSGKTTLAMHTAIGLLKAGQRVGTLDLDTDQRSLTRYLENRRVWANHRHLDLELPLHRSVPSAPCLRAGDDEARELAALQEAVAALEAACDFLVIDTASHDSYLMRLAHLVADTVLTPLQDSFLDLCPLGLVDPLTQEITHTGHYAAAVCAARKRRRQFDPGFCDWIVIRNRACEGSQVAASLAELGLQIGFRDAQGCAERAIYRQFFPLGLSAFDTLDERTLGMPPTQSHLAAQGEVRALLDCLQLPVGERGLRRAAARSEWLARKQAPLALDDIFEDGAALRAEGLT